MLTVAFSFASFAETEYCADGVSKVARPSSEFIILKDKGLVIDKRTQLMWKLCREGFSGPKCSYSGSEGDGYQLAKFNFLEAMQAAEDSTYADYNDWSLPNIKQLRSITEHACYHIPNYEFLPLVNPQIFPSDVSYVSSHDFYFDLAVLWSNTPRSGGSDVVLLQNDYFRASLYAKKDTSHFHIQLVRVATKSELMTLLNGEGG
jgi:hypothetical protein